MADFSTTNPRNQQTVQYTTPTTGSTIAAGSGANLSIIIDPVGSLLALTVTLNGSPQDGDIVKIASSQVVTTFTMSGGTVVGALTTLAASTFAAYIYNATATKWFRIG